MSRAARCLHNSLRTASHSRPSARLPSRPLPQGHTNAFNMTSWANLGSIGARSYGQAAVRQREDIEQRQEPVAASPPRRTRTAPPERQHGSERQVSSESDPNDPAFAATTYLNRLLHPLTFPPELARRILTHSSHALARRGHNGGLSFFGRRVLNTYTLLFLHASAQLPRGADIEDLAARTVHTSLLGQHLGAAWGVGREMVWAPSLPSRSGGGGGGGGGTQQDLEALRRAGLYKVQGEVVQAVVGAVYHQYGASVAHRLYHTRILPHILTKGGLPVMFHDEVRSIAARMSDAGAPQRR